MSKYNILKIGLPSILLFNNNGNDIEEQWQVLLIRLLPLSQTRDDQNCIFHVKKIKLI